MLPSTVVFTPVDLVHSINGNLICCCQMNQLKGMRDTISSVMTWKESKIRHEKTEKNETRLPLLFLHDDDDVSNSRTNCCSLFPRV